MTVNLLLSGAQELRTPGPLDWFGSAVALSDGVLVGVATGAIPSGLASSGVLHVFMRGKPSTCLWRGTTRCRPTSPCAGSTRRGSA